MEDTKIIKDYLQEVKDITDSVSIQDINKAVVIIYESWVKNRTIFICGNGGSASTASHFACDLVKLGVKVHCLNDNPALMTAITNDNGFDELYTEQMKNQFGQKDVLICLSVHGGTLIQHKGKTEMYRGKKVVIKDSDEIWSANIVNAAKFAKSRYGKVIGLIGYDGGLLKQFCEVPIIVGHSTPQTESWHLHIEHLICLLLKEYQPVKKCSKCQRIYKIDVLGCPSCGENNYELSGGIIGNIEELKK
jgi:D-sedoheptulose 7-phosphate isomerase